ncbi:biotin-dependent carboxyltransferase family protein [Candidatus Ruthia endofausta]|uniref:Biotin-dependent carboxyltransferase family protein n=1 Tax=Candidatus Ruthia endofausta TaxID=2738852 RepID=A0A6N0HNY6_9GAMM|nr:biotin-dependent carboxyltransferase family protein [Candidatus Ruthia endofausta]QKQ24033.1 biotin-dependent carboxyltransferase family protein [Candidatus Ruthia endofausta]
MSFKVIKSGFLATIQDYGRFDHAKHGMSRCGVMDEHAYSWANYLLNNAFDDAVLEITFGAVELEAQLDVLIVVTGADLDFKINHKSAAIWHSIQIHKGDTLSWNSPKSGIRTYLAVKNGFDAKVLFGSKSVNLREHISTKISQGKTLDYTESFDTRERLIPIQYIPNYNKDITLRLLPSYQFNEFSVSQRDLFFNQTYQITNDSDRTGCRLQGAPIDLKQTKMISEGMSYGSVEITTNGLPIILLKDAPTIGGYPKIGTVFSLDLAKLAQKQPNDHLRFELININEAQEERVVFNQFFNIKH